MQKIMIVEDDPAIRAELSLLLKNEGYAPLPVTNFDITPELAAAHTPDLIRLDLGLPGQDGLALGALL